MEKKEPFTLEISFVSNADKFRDVILEEHLELFEIWVTEQKSQENYLRTFQHEVNPDEIEELDRRLSKYHARKSKNSLQKRAKKLQEIAKSKMREYSNAEDPRILSLAEYYHEESTRIFKKYRKGKAKKAKLRTSS